MDGKKKMLIAVISIAIVSLAITTVTASLSTSNTPLYTFRMEQSSSKMNFLPTEMNTFTYTTENGYGLNYDILGCCGAEPLIMTYQYTCEFYPTCETCNTCSTCSTCSTCGGWTCDPTGCQITCGSSCGGTCSTCEETCERTCGETSCPINCMP
jgi:hypothetical protein